MNNPIDYYLGFDDQFFKRECKGVGSAYRNFLEQNYERINEVLKDPTKVIDDLEFYRELMSLEEDEQRHGQMLKKPYNGLTITIDDISENVGIPLTEHQKRYVDGRGERHLARLLLPGVYSDLRACWITTEPYNKHCETFVSDLIYYLATTPEEVDLNSEEMPDADKFEAFTGSEGDCVFIFWTLAPYVHLNLKESGFSPEQSMKKIIEWGQTGYDETNLQAKDYLDHIWEAGRYITLKPNPLGFDERMPTHLRTRLAARFVAAELVKN